MKPMDNSTIPVPVDIDDLWPEETTAVAADITDILRSIDRAASEVTRIVPLSEILPYLEQCK